MREQVFSVLCALVIALIGVGLLSSALRLGRLREAAFELPKETWVLWLLTQHGELYGLDLVRCSRGRLRRGTVYVVLGRMEQDGLIASRQEDDTPPHIGIPRRVYRLAPKGQVAVARKGWVT